MGYAAVAVFDYQAAMNNRLVLVVCIGLTRVPPVAKPKWKVVEAAGGDQTPARYTNKSFGYKATVVVSYATQLHPLVFHGHGLGSG